MVSLYQENREDKSIDNIDIKCIIVITKTINNKKNEENSIFSNYIISDDGLQ
jgi:uncharacterized protein (UPF0335 family)